MHHVRKTHHDALGNVRLRYNYSSKAVQNFDQHGIFFYGLKRPAGVSYGRIVTFDIVLIFECHWYSMKRSYGTAIYFKRMV